MKKEVFISYRQKDSTEFVRELEKQLSDKLSDWYDITYDKKNRHGERISTEIQNEIERCSYFIFILQEDTLDFSSANNIYERRWIIDELTWVTNKIRKKGRQRIIPIITKGKDMPPWQEPSNNITSDDILSVDKQQKNELNLDKAKELLQYAKNIKQEYDNNIKTIKAPIIEETDKNVGVEKKVHEILPKVMEALDAKDLIKSKEELKKTKEKLMKEQNRSKRKLIITLFLAFVLCCWFFNKLDNKDKMIKEVESKAFKSVKLVFAGGGSVVNMIKEITGVDSLDVKKYINSFYLDLPSKNAWSLLPEEIVNHHTADTLANKFYPICLSATEIENDSVLLKHYSKNYLEERGIIVSYFLGYDTLEVYFDDPKRGDTATITVDSLAKRIKQSIKDGKKLFCTQEGSGTYHQFKKAMQGKLELTKESLKDTLQWYNIESVESDYFNKYKKGYIILSSKYYTPDFVKEYHDYGFKVVDSKDTISKSMYLYFVAYKEKGDITIPDEMVQFLKSIVKHNNTLKKDTNQIKHSMRYRGYKNIITPLDTILKWCRNE